MSRHTFLVIYHLSDGTFLVPTSPVEARGWAVEEIWMFGQPVTDTEKELKQIGDAAAAMLPQDRINRFMTFNSRDRTIAVKLSAAAYYSKPFKADKCP